MRALPVRFIETWKFAECDREYEYEKDDRGRIVRDDKRVAIKAKDENGDPIIKKESKIEYWIEPIGNSLSTSIYAIFADPKLDDLGLSQSTARELGACIKGLRGVETIEYIYVKDEAGNDTDEAERDSEGNPKFNVIPFVLEYARGKVGKDTYKYVTKKCLDRIPRPLYNEMIKYVGDLTGATDDEEENLDFSSDSSS